MQLGEIYKYLPTSTVGKVQDMREKDGKTWAMLESTMEKPATYTVTMKGLTKDEAEEMLRLHPGEMVLER